MMREPDRNRTPIISPHTEVEELKLTAYKLELDLPTFLVQLGTPIKSLTVSCVPNYVSTFITPLPDMPPLNLPALTAVSLDMSSDPIMNQVAFAYTNNASVSFAAFAHILRAAPLVNSLNMNGSGNPMPADFVSAVHSLEHLHKLQIYSCPAPDNRCFRKTMAHGRAS
jgi:hypothetical protein